jgi:hypothetical protein
MCAHGTCAGPAEGAGLGLRGHGFLGGGATLHNAAQTAMLMVSSSQLYVRRDSAAFTICQCRFGRQGTGPGCRVGVGCACVLALAGRGVEKA